MDLSDTLSRPTAPERAPLGASGELGAASPEHAAMRSVDAAIDGGGRLVYGAGWDEARTAIADARARDGLSAFARVGTEPSAFGSVLGDASRATELGGALGVREQIAASLGIARPGVAAAGPRPADEPGRAEPESPPRGPEHGLDPARDAEQIRARLDPEANLLALDYGVTRPDIDAIRGIVDRFPSVEHGSRVLAALSPAELQRWADNLDDPAVQGGLGADERREHYAALARNLDTTQFGRFAEAVVEGSADGDREGRWFAYAAAPTAPTETLAGFVGQATGRGRDQDDARLAPAVGEAVYGLGQRDPAALATVLSRYAKEDTEWLVSGAVMDRMAQPGLGGTRGEVTSTIEHDGSSLSRALAGVARAGDLQRKADFFAEATGQLQALRDLPTAARHGVVHTGAGQASDQVRDGLTRVVRSDADGVVSQLLGDRDRTGEHTVSYVEALLAGGQTSQIRDTLARLGRGDTLRETPEARFGLPNSSTPAQQSNALALGHYTGAVAAALDNHYRDRREQAEALGKVFSGVVSVGMAGASPTTAAGRLAQGTASTGGGALTEVLATHVVESLDRFSRGNKTLDETLVDLAQPQVVTMVPRSGGGVEPETRPYNTPAMQNQFKIQSNYVVTQNMRQQNR